MKRPTNLQIFLIAILLSVSACESGGEKENFELNLTEGQEMKSHVDLDAVASVRVLGEVELKLNVGADLDYRVGATSNKSTRLDLTLANMEGVFQMHQGIIQTADIQSDQEFDIAELTDKYEGKTVTLLLDNQARVTGIDGLEEIVGEQTYDSLRTMAANAEKLLGENFFERLTAFTAVLPEKPVAIGDKWSTELEQEILGLPVQLISNFIYKESNNGIARFGVDAKFTMDTVKLNAEQFDFPFEGLGPASDNIRFLLRGTQKGYVDVNEKTGWSHGSELLQKFDLEFRFGMLTLPVELENKISISPAK